MQLLLVPGSMCRGSQRFLLLYHLTYVPLLVMDVCLLQGQRVGYLQAFQDRHQDLQPLQVGDTAVTETFVA